MIACIVHHFIVNCCHFRFCYMEPFKGQCADAEQKVKPGIVTVSTKRSGYDSTTKDSRSIKVEAVSDASNTG